MELHFKESNYVRGLISTKITRLEEQLKKDQEERDKWYKENGRYCLFIFDRFRNNFLSNVYNKKYDVWDRRWYYSSLLPKSVEIVSYTTYSKPFTSLGTVADSFSGYICYDPYTFSHVHFELLLPKPTIVNPTLQKLKTMLSSTPKDISVTLTDEEYNLIKEEKDAL